MSKSVVREYGLEGKRIRATAIACVTHRGTNVRVLHLASDWDINLSVVVDGCGHTTPKELLLMVHGRRGIKDLIELLEWWAAALRGELSEARMKGEAATWDIVSPGTPWLRTVESADEGGE